MKIDIYSHVMGPKFLDAFRKRVSTSIKLRARPYQREANDSEERNDINNRLKIMDKFPGLVQVLTPSGQSLETHTKPEDAAYLSKIFNDEMAELVHKYPDKFVAAVARLPMNNIAEASKEIDRAITQLGFKGIMIATPANGQPLDSPAFLPIYESMVKYDLPIWIHPTRLYSDPDYVGETTSKYGVFQAFGWPYETAVAMSRLVCSGIMAKYPTIKFITHHAGSMIPFFSGRIHMLEHPYEYLGENADPLLKKKLPEEYMKMFFNDTALYGNTPALMCAQAFFGTEHILFGTDLPYGPGFGEEYTRLAIEGVEGMSVSKSDKKKIFEDNAKKLLRLSI